MSVELPYFRFGRREGTTIVDEDTAVMINGRRLNAHGPHVFVGGKALHRLITGCARNDGKVVHHLNEDPTDNRRENLQVVESMLEHGALPHPWRDRFCSLLQRFDRERAWQILCAERAAVGLRPPGGGA